MTRRSGPDDIMKHFIIMNLQLGIGRHLSIFWIVEKNKIHNQEHPKVMQLGLLLLRNESNNRLTIHCILLDASKPLNDLPFQSNVRSKSALETALSTNLKIPLSRSIAHISTMKL